MPVVPEVQQPSMGGATSRLREFFGRANVPFLVTIAILVAFGLLIQFFVTRGSADYSFTRQLAGVVVGVALMLVFWKLDYQMFSQAVMPLLVIDVILLLSPHLPFIGYSAGGATSWVNIGIRFQPGEISKIVTILLMAAMAARYQGRIDSRGEYLKCLAMLAVPFLCIMAQPDLGTGLVLLVIGATILFVGGANRRYLVWTLVLLVALVVLVLLLDPVLDNMAGHDVFLKDYQKNRLLVFIDPSLDPTGAGYNLEQAKIAIGSGGFLGKELGNATQSALGFLPAAPTDFVFCTVAEQLGFVGVLILLALFGLMLFLTIQMSNQVESLFGRLVLMGVCGMWLFQILENVGMCCGLMPITGIPLPFISYGSSFMMVNFVCVGLVCSVWAHEQRTSSVVIAA